MARHTIQAGKSIATVCRHGAQVLSWSHAGTERLFLSPQATFAPGSAIRGGVPVIFPQFGERGPGRRHGFARTATWDLVGGGAPGDAMVEFALRNGPDRAGPWADGFDARIRASTARDRLTIALGVANTGDAPFSFTCALHTYLRVDDIATACIRGLHGVAYQDATRADAWAVDEAPVLRFAGEVDRVYRDAPRQLVLAGDGPLLHVEQEGFTDTVVWNPGAALASTMPDLGEGGHRHFACIEAACVHEPIVLAPGARWDGRQVLIV